MIKIKIKDAVQVKVPVGHGRVGDVQKLTTNSKGVKCALVRFMGSQVKRWFRISDLIPLDFLND